MKDTITIIGNVVAEPERRVTRAGEAVISFRVASTERRYDRATARWVEGHTNFFGVSAFRALAANALASLHKGERVIVSGALQVKSWDNGTKQGTDVEIVADAIGHDLQFGTTHYSKGVRTVSETDASADEGASSAGAVDHWPTAAPPDADGSGADTPGTAPDWGAPAELVAQTGDAPF